jgi:hypothetical protein
MILCYAMFQFRIGIADGLITSLQEYVIDNLFLPFSWLRQRILKLWIVSRSDSILKWSIVRRDRNIFQSNLQGFCFRRVQIWRSRARMLARSHRPALLLRSLHQPAGVLLQSLYTFVRVEVA